MFSKQFPAIEHADKCNSKEPSQRVKSASDRCCDEHDEDCRFGLEYGSGDVSGGDTFSLRGVMAIIACTEILRMIRQRRDRDTRDTLWVLFA